MFQRKNSGQHRGGEWGGGEGRTEFYKYHGGGEVGNYLQTEKKLIKEKRDM